MTDGSTFCPGVKCTLTALDLQRAGLCVQREAAQVHVAHGGDSHSAVVEVGVAREVEGGGVGCKKQNKSKITGDTKQ